VPFQASKIRRLQNKLSFLVVVLPSFRVNSYASKSGLVRADRRSSRKSCETAENRTVNDIHQTTAHETRAYGRSSFSLPTRATEFSELAFYSSRVPSVGKAFEKKIVSLNSLEPFQLSNMTLREEFATRNFSEL
jgi:hypothetical protein